MENKRYQIFISSTYTDLIEIRQKATEIILKTGNIPIGMEMFSADDEEQWKQIKKGIESSDYYVVIVGHRYGSTVKGGKSYTQKEYEYAKEIGIPVMAFIISDDAPVIIKNTEIDLEKLKKLNDFKEELKKKYCAFWRNADDFGIQLLQAITNMIRNKPRVGWIRADNFIDNTLLKSYGLEEYSQKALDFIKQSIEEKVYFDYYERTLIIEVLHDTKEFLIQATNEVHIKNIKGKKNFYEVDPVFPTKEQAESYKYLSFEVNQEDRLDLVKTFIEESRPSRQLRYRLRSKFDFSDYENDNEIHILHKYSYKKPIPDFFQSYQFKVPCRRFKLNAFLKNGKEYKFVDFGFSTYRSYKENNHKAEIYNDGQMCQLNFEEWVPPRYGFVVILIQNV